MMTFIKHFNYFGEVSATDGLPTAFGLVLLYCRFTYKLPYFRQYVFPSPFYICFHDTHLKLRCQRVRAVSVLFVGMKVSYLIGRYAFA